MINHKIHVQVLSVNTIMNLRPVLSLHGVHPRLSTLCLMVVCPLFPLLLFVTHVLNVFEEYRPLALCLDFVSSYRLLTISCVIGRDAG